MQIEAFKKVEPLLREGEYYRLNELEEQSQYSAWEFAARDGSEALVNLVIKHVKANAPLVHVRLKGLVPEGTYCPEGTEERYTGAALMRGGYTFPMLWGDYPSMQLRFIRVD